MKRVDSHVFQGMQRDLDVAKHPSNFLYDAKNIRLTAREGNTMLAITNEIGTADLQISVSGTYLGHCLLNRYLVVFSTTGTGSKPDYITRIDLMQDPLTDGTEVLHNGDLNFNTGYPIDAIGSYESEKVQKVYWTDGFNQPRMINIATGYDLKNQNADDTAFDFIPTLKLQEKVYVEKLLGASGIFAPGIIQYAFTYYRKYGQESNIFYTSPLLYISYYNRGASPEDKVDNAFKITITNVDKSFDYLRIYSIQRTSLNGTPICKRVQDIDLTVIPNSQSLVSYTDAGTSGDIIDPTELLYKGGEPVSAGTIEQKDNTLFLGNITLKREPLIVTKEELRSNSNLTFNNNIYRTITPTEVSKNTSSYPYWNQLSSYVTEYISGTPIKKSVPCAGFKHGDYYRLGIQFQHESGRWSDPLYFDNKQVLYHPSGESSVRLPVFSGELKGTVLNRAQANNYRRVRTVVVYPSIQDRKCLCQGVVNPTVFTYTSRVADKNIYAQSSWFFRPICHNYNGAAGGTYSPVSTGTLEYTQRNIRDDYPVYGKDCYTPQLSPYNIKQVEIQGDFNDNNGSGGVFTSGNKFNVDWETVTLHSPDIEFDDSLATTGFTNFGYQTVGKACFTHTMSDIDIQTETPPVSNSGSGFVHKAFTTSGSYGIIAGLFYDDYLVDDHDIGEDDAVNVVFEKFTRQKAPAKFMVYPWQKSGSLNNDITRPADKGTTTAILKKKIISNLRYAGAPTYSPGSYTNPSNVPQLFSSDQVTIVKLGGNIYQGNVDTSIVPDNADGVYFAWAAGLDTPDIQTGFTSPYWWKTFSKDPDKQDDEGIRQFIQTSSNPNVYEWRNYGLIGDDFIDLDMKKDAVRMKYKSTPHIVMDYNTTPSASSGECAMNVVELQRSDFQGGSFDASKLFGGESEDALKENIWVPCGEPVSLFSSGSNGGSALSSVNIEWSWGDTYFQRYDCLKTYPFTREDINQIVEIGSFMLETHVNIDGRYDRNRGQATNFNMSPENFNLINHVYSQTNNFFTYRIMDDDYYTNNQFPNQITWTKEKQSGADVDMWTNITLGSVYDMDGSKGKVVSINAWKDQLFCFQEKGVSTILFNSRVQIPASDGVPIEISNSYKVDGYRYISDGIGCNDRLQIKETTSGIYFIDSVSGHLHHVGDGLKDIAATNNMTTWFRDNGHTVKKLLYDDINHDLYCIQNSQALCFSEMLSQFTSFMDYGNISLIETCGHRIFTMKNSRLFGMFEGEYCDFFGTWSTVNNDDVYTADNKSWGFTFISNGPSEGITDKIFTNLEFRASVEGDGNEIMEEVVDPETEETTEVPTGKFAFELPLDYLEVWDEYQHGFANLDTRSGNSAFQHHAENGNASIKRRFRIWRCDIPRNNAPLTSDEGLPHLSRKIRKPVDRMRNPWLYIKLQKDAAESMHKTEIHDMNVIYYN